MRASMAGAVARVARIEPRAELPSPVQSEPATLPPPEIVEGVYTNFALGEVPAVLGALAENIEWSEAEGFPLAGTYVGPQAVLEGVFQRLGEIGDEFAAFPTKSSQRVTRSLLSAPTAGSTRAPVNPPR